jgi:hypothetical protein
LNRLSAEYGVELWSPFRDREDMEAFVMSLPAKAMVCRMRMTAHEDQTFRWQRNDLNDVVALGTAAAYCHVVVGERHWVSVLNRHASTLAARVTWDLLDLPRLIASGSKG